VENVYVTDKAVPSYDALVSDLIAATEDQYGGGGKPMDVGVENEQGEVYRKVRCWGLGEYVRFTQGMLGLGFKDTLANVLSQGGLDSRFAATDKVLRASAVPLAPPPAESTPLEEIEAASDSLADLPETERDAVVKSRLGQGIFRQQLVEYWRGCAVTGASFIQLLRASHIKPWRVATNAERLDRFNGLLLTPTLDAAFDGGLVTFERNGKIVIAPKLSGSAAYELHISPKMRIDPKKLIAEHEPYLSYHREHIFGRSLETLGAPRSNVVLGA
jgi:hypothetical protein